LVPDREQAFHASRARAGRSRQRQSKWARSTGAPRTAPATAPFLFLHGAGPAHQGRCVAVSPPDAWRQDLEKHQTKREGSEKALPSFPLAFLRETKNPHPNPRNDQTVRRLRHNLAGGLSGEGATGCDTSKVPAFAKAIVNLTLTAQSARAGRLRHGRCSVCLAQHNPGMRVRESETDMSQHAGHGGGQT
jgi:hypothetical protein